MERRRESLTAGTYLVLVILVEIQTSLLARFPLRGNGLVDISLVNDLGYHQGLVVYEL